MKTSGKTSPALWHALPPDEVCAHLDAPDEGLETAQAAQRLADVGRNELPRRAPPGILRLLLRQCKSPFVYLLLVAAVVSLATGETLDASFILIVLAVNAVIGAVQEGHAEHSAQALDKLVQQRATVCRAAGVSVRMITGDHPATALAIGRELGVAAAAEEVVTGAQIAAAAVAGGATAVAKFSY